MTLLEDPEFEILHGMKPPMNAPSLTSITFPILVGLLLEEEDGGASEEDVRPTTDITRAAISISKFIIEVKTILGNEQSNPFGSSYNDRLA